VQQVALQPKLIFDQTKFNNKPKTTEGGPR